VAGFFFLLSAYGAVQVGAQLRRRIQIQVEDHTFDEAEWTTPRKITDSRTDNADTLAANRRKPFKFMALGIGMLIFVAGTEPWKKHWQHAMVVTLLMAGCVAVGFWRWRNYPRYPSTRSVTLALPRIMGLLTLLFFDGQQFMAYSKSDAARMVSSAQVVTFNIVAILAYSALYAWLAWRSKKAGIAGR
jgi:hypothetical protein